MELKAEAVFHLSGEGGITGHFKLRGLPAQRPTAWRQELYSGECDARFGGYAYTEELHKKDQRPREP